jgi:HD-GYP domain-containing protein (c-di-GMP phosphodiesterase class II)
MSVSAALAELAACAGTQFDPQIVEAVIRVVGPGGAVVGRPAVMDLADVG